MIGNIPAGWRVEKMVNLSKILDGDRGKNYPKREDFSDNDYCLFLTTKNVSKKGFKFDSTQFISKDKDEILRKGRLERNDLVITTRGTVGNIAFFNQDVPFDIIRINSGMAIIRITAEDLSHSFVNTYFKSNIFYRYVSEIISGSAQPQITITKLKNLTIPIPPPPQQEKIVKVLDISSALIEKQKELISNYDLFLKSKFIEMFGDPIKNPMKWEVVNLGNCCHKVTDGTHDTPERLPSGIKFITGKHIRPYKIDYINSDYVNEIIHKEIYKRCNPEYGDVLYTNIGVNLGTAAMNMVNYEFSMKNVALLKNDISRCNSRFLEAYLNSEKFIFFIKTISSIGGAQQFLSLKEIKRLKLFLPNIVLQKQFANIVKRIDEIRIKEEQKLEHLETLHKSLMDKAFKGEVK
ncbi:MAG: restriction endonuclease subunit S [Sulfurimonas sp.]|nr:restriction endonuclease subunit S [Sulfurimonas sp.]